MTDKKLFLVTKFKDATTKTDIWTEITPEELELIKDLIKDDIDLFDEDWYERNMRKNLLKKFEGL